MDILAAKKTDTIAIFGGSGATGKALISQVLDNGLGVRALARKAASIDTRPDRVEAVEGSLDSADDVRRTLNGCCAAICVFGPRPPYTDVFCETATTTIVAAMERLGIQRLVCQTGAMIGDYAANRTLPFQFMADTFQRRSPRLALDRERQEGVIIDSGLAWTIVKPPRLTNGAAKGRWVAGPDVRVGLLSSIVREDLAAFLAAETLRPEHIRQAVFIRS